MQCKPSFGFLKQLPPDYVIILAVRGDPSAVKRQLDNQIPSGQNLCDKTVIIVGPIFGSRSLTCTPRKPPTKHPEQVIMKFILKLSMSCKVHVLPARIDMALVTGPVSKFGDLICGTAVQKKAFGKSTDLKALKRLFVKEVDTHSLNIKASRAHTKNVKDILKNVPSRFWPTAFNVTYKQSGGHVELVEPLWAEAYHGIGGIDLHGVLATGLQSALYRHKKENSGSSVQFGKIFEAEGRSAIAEYEKEANALMSTCPVGMCDHKMMPPKATLHWPVFKSAWVQKFGPDITKHVGAMKKTDVFLILDRILVN